MDWVLHHRSDCRQSLVGYPLELATRLTLMAGDHCMGAISAHHSWFVDLGIVLAHDCALVGNSRVGGLDAVASVQFDQREVGAFG